MTTNTHSISNNTTTLQTGRRNPPIRRNAKHHPINQQGLILLFNPCCLGCPVLLVLPGVSW